jgi:hypothetical protein
MCAVDYFYYYNGYMAVIIYRDVPIFNTFW